LDRIQSRVATDSGGVDVFARIVGLTVDTNLRPGAFVEVTVPGAVFKNVVRIPAEALHGGYTVYATRGERLIPRQVEVVGRDGDHALVRGAFEPGEWVVTTRFPEIGPGLRIKLEQWPELEVRVRVRR
ncbi:MAG: hypothetical protein AAF942_11365, partial [Pseudomonadota bacterium]